MLQRLSVNHSKIGMWDRWERSDDRIEGPAIETSVSFSNRRGVFQRSVASPYHRITHWNGPVTEGHFRLLCSPASYTRAVLMAGSILILILRAAGE